MDANNLPKVGDDIYVPSAFFLSHGSDDQVGGLAKVERVRVSTHNPEIHFISVKEVNGDYNWEQYLAPQQEELKERFGTSRAYPDPDDRPEFNNPFDY